MKRLFPILLMLLCLYVNAQKSDFKHIDFAKADSIAKSYSKASLRNMPLLVHNLTHNLNTQVEQFRAIHTWVCFNIESDHYFSEATLKKRRQLHDNISALEKWNTKQQTKVFKRLVRDKKTICSGYAYILKALTNLADIECEIVDGYARTVRTNVNTADFPNHSWNVVKLNDKWYFADTTQASGFYNLDDQEFVKNYTEGYFLASPELFAKNHYPLNDKWLLLDEKPTLKQFVKAPIIYQNTYKHGVIPITPSGLITTIEVGESISFQFKVLEENCLEDISLFNDSLRNKKIKQTERIYNNGLLKITYQFDKKGQFDVHTKVGKDVVSSFTVKVVAPNAVALGDF